jgi:D-lyxose ketol-isomerase
MKRSEINRLVRDATRCFEAHGWALPPNPKWDVTDFGLGDPRRFGLVLINLAEEPEYCEKLMYAKRGMTTPSHTHKQKKEDIICRWGKLRIQLWPSPNDLGGQVEVKVNGESCILPAAAFRELSAGERITLLPGTYHEFYPVSEECIIGEVSTANDDLHDNHFVNRDVGRFSQIDEDEVPLVRLIGEAPN